MKYFAALSLLCTLSLLLLLPACKPSADESIDRISRAWQVNKYYEDNEDFTAAFKAENKNYTLQFYPDLTFLQSAVVNDTFYTHNGTWAFSEQLDSLYLYRDVDTTRYYIRLLRQKNLNIRKTISDTTYDYLMVDY